MTVIKQRKYASEATSVGAAGVGTPSLRSRTRTELPAGAGVCTGVQSWNE